ncbi:MAG: DUF1631 domain-containing protein, partial [Proteobacteria bacterium]|nr:DUF1631 domain-containing protein [Pseudomonadota bacterium]
LNPLTNLALFVNPKGQKPLKKDLPELAIEIVSGTVVQVNFITKGFIAKALDTVYDKLSKLRKTFKTSTVKPE